MKQPFYLLLFLTLLLQGFSSRVHGQRNPRAEIDSLRWGVDLQSAEAFRRANRAIHLDSTYYVGYLIKGYHFFERAEERSGLAKAAEPLRKAMDLFEQEFGNTFSRRFTRDDIYQGAWQVIFRQLDYYDAANRLINCYISLEEPEQAYEAVMRLKRANLVFDFQSYHWLAWLYFRTRIYGSDRYPFLKDSIQENIETAFQYTDSLRARYARNAPFIRENLVGAFLKGSDVYNSFDTAFLKAPKRVIANTLGILYGYDFQPEVAATYFKQIDGGDNLAKIVNLGYTYHSNIQFRTAENYFANVPDEGSKSRGGHWQGYSTLFVYKAEPLEGALKLRQERDQHGFTIGYGWDNLCLARMYLYAGYIGECVAALDRAENFTEVHYNTSFREDQYRFMLGTLRLLQTNYQLAEQRFEKRHPYLSWSWWRDYPRLLFRKYSTVYDLANELAKNPEREVVYYHLFHSENIISFDEVWEIIRNYSRGFFEKELARLAAGDPRSNLQRYYQYFLGRLEMEDGREEDAYDQLSALLSSPEIDQDFEKLLIARIHEACAVIAAKKGWEAQLTFHLNELYRLFPQLLPYSQATMAFRLNIDPAVTDDPRPAVAQALAELRDCRIDFDPPSREAVPELNLSLDDQRRLHYQVVMNREVFVEGSVDPSRPQPGKTLAYALFKIAR